MSREIVIEKVSTIDSTNLEMKRRIRENHTRTDILIADEQTLGRGRLGRTFESPKGTGLYMSLCLKPDFDAEGILLITSAAAVAVCRGIRKVTNLSPQIKWVNDIYINEKKVCGILAEAVTDSNGEMHVVLGIGINISTDEKCFSEDVRNIAGALYDEDSDIDVDIIKNELAQKIANEFYVIYEDILNRSFLKDYKDWSMVIGKEVRFLENEVWYEAVAVDIDNNGGLIVKNGDFVRTLSTGEITLRFAE